jgi:hypothetical protein
MKRIIFTSLLLLMSLGMFLAFAENEPLNHYGVATLTDAKVEADFIFRFHTEGKPVFIIADIRRGVAIGDMIRFKTRIVLIDPEVWQTMKITGVLDKLKTAPVVEVSAQATSEVWKSRADIAENREKIAYTLGAEFITILEDYFGTIPKSMELTFSFEGNRMSVIAPDELLALLKFIKKPIRAPIVSNSTPLIVSEPPLRAFQGEAFNWPLWAVDRAVPSEDLIYSLESELPPGLHWDAAHHTLIGKPEKSGSWTIKVRATNASKKSDELAFRLPISQNAKPKIWGEPARELGSDGLWRFQPDISDPDHLFTELKMEVFDLPAGMTFDRSNHTFFFKTMDASKINTLTFAMKVTDPLGASDVKKFNLAAPSGLHFQSALNSNLLQTGQKAYYTPVANGPSRGIRYAAKNAAGEKVENQNGCFPLDTKNPGANSMEIQAEDDLGNQAFQRIDYEVMPGEEVHHYLEMRAKRLFDFNTSGQLDNYSAFLERGNSRFGVFSTQFDQMPLFTFGFNITSPAAVRKENTLFLTGGVNFKGIQGATVGGLYLGLEGRQYLGGKNILIEYGAEYMAKQGLVLFSPKAFKKNDVGDTTMQNCLNKWRNEVNYPDSLMNGFLNCHDGIKQTLDIYEQPDNEVFLLNMSVSYAYRWGLWTGPAYWLVDYFHSDAKLEQNIGWALKYRANLFNTYMDSNLKIGLDGGNWNPKLQGGLALRVGLFGG